MLRPADDPSTVVRREIAEARECRDRVEVLDRAERDLAMADLADGDSEFRRLRRYEATWNRRLRRCLARP